MDTNVLFHESVYRQTSSQEEIADNPPSGITLSVVDWERTFIKECPDPFSAGVAGKDRFAIPAALHCAHGEKCVSIIRKLKKTGKTMLEGPDGRSAYRSMIVKMINLFEQKIRNIENTVPLPENYRGKLAFIHYLAAVTLMCGIVAEVVDNYEKYYYHREQSMRYNSSCPRIWSLPRNFHH